MAESIEVLEYEKFKRESAKETERQRKIKAEKETEKNNIKSGKITSINILYLVSCILDLEFRFT